MNEKDTSYNTKFHTALREYGIDKFTFEVLITLTPEEYTRQKLNELEVYYIDFFNSYGNGYNMTKGGDYSINPVGLSGSKNGRALVNEQDVEYIRECYNAKIPFKTVYAEYQDKISKRGFQNIWWFKHWKNIHPEYHTEENKKWHSHEAKANPTEVASNNKRKFSAEQVVEMRKMYENGYTVKQIQKIKSLNIGYGTLYNIIKGNTYKDV